MTHPQPFKQPPWPPRPDLPTMYELPSESPEDPGLPDEFHYYQPHLLQETFCPPNWPAEHTFAAGDLNLYYDPQHLQRYKRPDWFAVLGVSRLYQGHDMRLSYVIWQERVTPFLVVELLSVSTRNEDLGKTSRRVEQPPSKWEVYEQILGIPYYLVFERDAESFRVFALQEGRYREAELERQGFWFKECKLGLGLWRGRYRHLEKTWLRWYDAEGNWVPTGEERQASLAKQEKQRAEQEKQRAEQEKQRADRLAEKLRALGMDPEAD